MAGGVVYKLPWIWRRSIGQRIRYSLEIGCFCSTIGHSIRYLLIFQAKTVYFGSIKDLLSDHSQNSSIFGKITELRSASNSTFLYKGAALVGVLWELKK